MADIKVQEVPELFAYLSVKAHLPLVAHFRFQTCTERSLQRNRICVYIYFFIYSQCIVNPLCFHALYKNYYTDDPQL